MLKIIQQEKIQLSVIVLLWAWHKSYKLLWKVYTERTCQENTLQSGFLELINIKKTCLWMDFIIKLTELI